MTYRTNDLDTPLNTNSEASAPVRHLRRRRRHSALGLRGHNMSGANVSGFGI